jgi:hypothetical protein
MGILFSKTTPAPKVVKDPAEIAREKALWNAREAAPGDTITFNLELPGQYKQFSLTTYSDGLYIGDLAYSYEAITRRAHFEAKEDLANKSTYDATAQTYLGAARFLYGAVTREPMGDGVENTSPYRNQLEKTRRIIRNHMNTIADYVLLIKSL